MPRFIVLRADPGFVGADGVDFQEFPNDVTDEELSDAAWQFALDWAESYGVYHAPYYTDEDIENDDPDGDHYSDNIDGWWEEYDPEKHDGLTVHGNCPFKNYPNAG